MFTYTRDLPACTAHCFEISNNAQRWPAPKITLWLNLNQAVFYVIIEFSYFVNSSKFRERSTSLERCDCRLSTVSALKEMI